MYDHHRNYVAMVMRNPSDAYASPMDVVDDDGLDLADKKRILVAWHWDMVMVPGADKASARVAARGGLRDLKLALAALACRSGMC